MCCLYRLPGPSHGNSESVYLLELRNLFFKEVCEALLIFRQVLETVNGDMVLSSGFKKYLWQAPIPKYSDLISTWNGSWGGF